MKNISDIQRTADLIAGHRSSIAPIYQDLLSGGRFDSTDAKHLTDAEAMNLENYLYLVMIAFGLVQVVMTAGAFVIVAGLALVLARLLLSRHGS